MKERGWSYRRARIATGIDHGTIGDMATGVVPRKGVVVDWAQTLKENVNWWLELAGYDPIPENLVCDFASDRVREHVLEYMSDIEFAEFVRDRMAEQGGPRLSDESIEIIHEAVKRVSKKTGINTDN